jgi:hypothetical protein
VQHRLRKFIDIPFSFAYNSRSAKPPVAVLSVAVMVSKVGRCPKGERPAIPKTPSEQSITERPQMAPVSCLAEGIPSKKSTQSTPSHNAISCDIPTACKLSGISRSYLYLVLGRGDVVSIKAGRRRLVLVDSLRVWLQSLPSDGLSRPASEGDSQTKAARLRP